MYERPDLTLDSVFFFFLNWVMHNIFNQNILGTP